MPDPGSRRWLPLPSGAWIPLMRCDDPVWLTAKRIAARVWHEQFPCVFPGSFAPPDQWLMTTIAETPRHAYLHAALSRMTSPNTGGLLTNLRRARTTTTLYLVSSSFEVALCHRDAPFECGPSDLLLLSYLYEAKAISKPPALHRLEEIHATRPSVDIIVLPPSPLMSNQTRLQMATPALVRRRTTELIHPDALQ